MQYLLSKEEYDDLIHAKELADEKFSTCEALKLASEKLEAVKYQFIQDLSKLCGEHRAALHSDSLLGHNYQMLVRGVREALANCKL